MAVPPLLVIRALDKLTPGQSESVGPEEIPLAGLPAVFAGITGNINSSSHTSPLLKEPGQVGGRNPGRA